MYRVASCMHTRSMGSEIYVSVHDWQLRYFVCLYPRDLVGTPDLREKKNFDQFYSFVLKQSQRKTTGARRLDFYLRSLV